MVQGLSVDLKGPCDVVSITSSSSSFHDAREDVARDIAAFQEITTSVLLHILRERIHSQGAPRKAPPNTLSIAFHQACQFSSHG